jgi:hypothetical protein
MSLESVVGVNLAFSCSSRNAIIIDRSASIVRLSNAGTGNCKSKVSVCKQRIFYIVKLCIITAGLSELGTAEVTMQVSFLECIVGAEVCTHFKYVIDYLYLWIYLVSTGTLLLFQNQPAFQHTEPHETV